MNSNKCMVPKANPLPDPLFPRIPSLSTVAGSKSELSSVHTDPVAGSDGGRYRNPSCLDQNGFNRASCGRGNRRRRTSLSPQIRNGYDTSRSTPRLVLEPIVQQLSRISVPRPAGAFIAIFLTAALAIGIGYALVGQLRHFASELPKYSARHSPHHPVHSGATRET